MAVPDDVDFKFVVKDVPDHFICNICLSYLKQPQMVNCCEKCFCKDCLCQWKRKNKSCPACRSTEYSFMDMPRISAKIGALEVYCPNRHHGCNEIMALRDGSSHLSKDNPKGCLFIQIPCPNACGVVDIFRTNIEEHCRKICPMRKVNCPHCDLSGEHHFIFDEHVKECSLFPLTCPNDCGMTVARRDLPGHKHSCPLELLECPFKGTGCPVSVCRKNVEKHLQTSLKEHLTLLSIAHMSLTDDHLILRKDYSCLRSDYETLHEKYEELQEAHLSVENKLYNAGKVINNLLPLTNSFPPQGHKSNVALQQVNTILVDKSTRSLGDSISLALSSIAGGGAHQFIVDRISFQLEWSYVLRKLELKLFWISSGLPCLPPTWSCDFIMKFQPSHTDNILYSATPTTSSISTTQILAVVCCGKPQTCMEQTISAGKKSLIGPIKIIPTYSDVTLILSLQLHAKQLSYLPPASQSMGTPFGTPFNMAQVFTCPCACHGDQETRNPVLLTRKVSKSAKKIVARRIKS